MATLTALAGAVDCSYQRFARSCLNGTVLAFS
jgi:hypothetical protein